MSVAITFSNLKSMIPTLLSGDESNLYSVLIRGRHGIGKSWVAYQTASGSYLGRFTDSPYSRG
jgi:hypothetical protein